MRMAELGAREQLEQFVAAERWDEAVALLKQLASQSESLVQRNRFFGLLDELGDLRSRFVRTKLLVLRSITLEPMEAALRCQGIVGGLDLEIEWGEYNQFEQHLLSPIGARAASPEVIWLIARPEEMCLSWPDLLPGQYEAVVAQCLERISSWVELAQKQFPGAVVFVSNVPRSMDFIQSFASAGQADGKQAALDAWNAQVSELCASKAGAYLFDLNAVLAQVGHAQAFDSRMYLHASQPFSKAGMDGMAATLARMISAAKTPRKKCIVLDADNTLWGGVVGEDGLSGIGLGGAYPGNAYKYFQEQLKQLKHRGILLALCSKNNEADVSEVFEKHGDRVLELDDFVATRVNWEPKPLNIQSIAQELNIGLDSLIFIDDSDIECASVSSELPMVKVVQAPAGNPIELLKLLDNISEIDVLEVSDTDFKRTQSYHDQAQRAQLQERVGSLDDFLSQLELRVKFELSGAEQLSRVSQLTQRTNQFNLTTRRYTEADIKRFVESERFRVWHIGVEDRFGDYGVTGVVIVEFSADGCSARIDSFMLSCRVLGRRVETALVSTICNVLADFGCQSVVAERIPSAKNQQTESFWVDHGFLAQEVVDSNVERLQRWEFDLTAGLPTFPDSIRVSQS